MTNQAPELLRQFLNRKETGVLTAQMLDAAQAEIERHLTRPPSERPVAQVREALTLVDAFDIGFCWRGVLQGQNIEDSRAVGRTLLSDIFEKLPINIDGFNSFLSGDAGIVEAKRRIRNALTAERPEAAVAWAARTIFDELCPGIRWDERDRPAYESAARKVLYAIQHEEPGREEPK